MPPDGVPATRPGWRTDCWRDATGAVVGVVCVPVGDAIDHDDGLGDDECVCGPRSELLDTDEPGDVWMITHQALDGRA